MLSELSSVYDLFGFITAFLLQGRRIIQVLCQKELGWDEMVPDEVAEDSVVRILCYLKKQNLSYQPKKISQ